MKLKQLLIIIVFGWFSVTSSQAKEFPAYNSQVLTTKLEQPWALTELTPGVLIISEKTGRLKLWQEGKLQPAIKGVPEVFDKSQGGLLDVKAHPQFARNRWLYFSYAYGNDKANALRVSRGKLTGNHLTELEALITIEPFKNTPVHYGGRLAFLADGTLLITSGDGFDYREQAQVLDNLLGKIIRINDDGSVPTDNPLFNKEITKKNNRSEIWSYGHRNPQGLVYDSVRDIVWGNEHGPAGGDEINIIEPGKNYGWPVITQGKDYSGATISPFKDYPGMEQPYVNWTPSIAPSSMVVYRGQQFPQLDGDLLVSTLKDQNVVWLELDGLNVVKQTPVFTEFKQRMRDITIDSEGNIYLITDQGSLIKISSR